ncbi:putative ornithine decarboxylase [Oratosquilla oratoria]|uniref:putative ornithine decarboxylase n=1 Tax=Oratosquilla oratoria TaxID=337810 RepID=UPI003F76DAC8
MAAKAKKREEVPTTIFGQTCDGQDVVCKDVTLPTMQTGEWLMWEDMGAYTVSTTTNFNGFKPAKVILTMSTELLDSGLLDRFPWMSSEVQFMDATHRTIA